jgi:hypothetical protein
LQFAPLGSAERDFGMGQLSPSLPAPDPAP